MSEMTVKEMEKLHGRHNRLFRNISLKYKIAMMTALVALIPMITLACLMVFFYNRAITERGNRQIQENIKIMSDRIAAVIDNGTVCSNNFTISLSDFYNDRSMKRVTRESRILSEMSQDLLIYRGISSIVFLNDEGLFITTDPSLNDLSNEIRDSFYVKSLEGTNGKTLLMNAENNPMSRPEKEVVTLGKRVINTVTGEGLGYVLINLDKTNLVESAESEISYYFLFDMDGFCISEEYDEDVLKSAELQKKLYLGEDALFEINGKKAELRFHFENLNKNSSEDSGYDIFGFDEQGAVLRYGNETYLISRNEIKSYHWILVGITNLNKFNVSGDELRLIMLITSTVAALLLLISIALSVTLITKPFRRMMLRKPYGKYGPE